ncbi:Receptor-like protein 34 [Camellia lanceoleosa]|uniref:Receptor-like protein 34 n=1 Tax=Camellia lanceoleosa TaxID=1840588 RepID=A0ACC0G0C7_9ERIC|nr:Receptor-like protein 34 [Camellia lanceoleosa]
MGTTSSALVMLFALFFIERLEFICSSTNSNVTCIASEREALMKIKGNLTDEANRLSSWVGKNCCTWKGVGCSHKTGHVVKLDLRNPIPATVGTLLSGQVSPSLLDLNHLHYLDLSMNDMQISNSLGSLKSLRYLDLSGSIFDATIPHNLGNLSRLQYLNLSNSGLSSPIPVTLGRLTSLTVLDLSTNYFNDSMLYPLCNLSSLVHIDLSFNRHGGAIPHCIGNLASLSILRLNYNQLQGPIPGEIGNMTQLTELDLSSNAFQGEIPNSMRNLCNLRVLDLSHNIFTGNLSTSVGSPFDCIHNSLEDLSLSFNKLSGGSYIQLEKGPSEESSIEILLRIFLSCWTEISLNNSIVLVYVLMGFDDFVPFVKYSKMVRWGKRRGVCSTVGLSWSKVVRFDWWPLLRRSRPETTTFAAAAIAANCEISSLS